MKQIAIKLIFLVSFAIALIACNETMGDKDSQLSEVKTLIEPLTDKYVELDPLPSASVYFEWDYVPVESSGLVVYQIAFDKLDGDFSNPVYLLNSDNNGYYNNATISHKQLNKIAGMMGITASATGGFKWTVFASKGMKTVKSEQENTIAVTRLAGFDDLPIEVYLTGEASEGGSDVSKAHKMKTVAVGEFEVYTKLVAGKPFHFVEGASNSPREFYSEGGIIKEDGTASVSEDGIYRITFDFVTGACTYTLVTRIGFYFSPEDEILFDLPYIGYGIFQTRATVTFKQESWGRDQRYKFRVFMKGDAGAGDEKEWEWCTLNGTDSSPTASSPESYYYLRLKESMDQWEDKWKLMDAFDGVEAEYTIYLTADQPYTHTVIR